MTGSEKFATCQAVETLRPLSYDAKLADAFDMIPVVMESKSKSCDMFSGDFCAKFARGKTSNVPVDTCIMSTIHGFLADCEAMRPPNSPRCNAMDIGANMGTMTSNMLKAGARVTAIEPQRDLAQLVWATACLNQWSDRLTLFGNAVTHLATEAGSTLELGNREKAGEWGFRPDGSHLSKSAKTLQATKIFVEQAVGDTRDWSYVKIDTDAIDDELTASFIQLIEAGKVQVTTFQVESPKAEVVHALQSRHGYSTYITVNPHTQFNPESSWEASVSPARVVSMHTHQRIHFDRGTACIVIAGQNSKANSRYWPTERPEMAGDAVEDRSARPCGLARHVVKKARARNQYAHHEGPTRGW